MCPWKPNFAQGLPLADGSSLPLEIRGVPARHRDLWIVLQAPGEGVEAARYLLRRFRETAAVVALPELSAPGAEGAEALGRGLAILDALDERFGQLSGRLFLAAFPSAGELAATWALRNPGRVAGLALLAPDPVAWHLNGPELEQGLSMPTLLIYGREDPRLWEGGWALCRRVAGPMELVVLPAEAALWGSPEVLFERLRAFWRGAAPRPSRPKRVRDTSRPKTMRRKRKVRGK